MLKSIVSIIVAAAFLCIGAFYEDYIVNKQFDDFSVAVEALYQKTEKETANKEDGIALWKNWQHRKRILQIFIMHNEIREFELWIAEYITLIDEENYKDALPKLEVLRILLIESPRCVKICLGNIF